MFPEALDEGWEEKRKYCLFKAGTILKALKQGIQPPRGNPADPDNDGLRENPDQQKEEVKEEVKENGFNPPGSINDIVSGFDDIKIS